MMMLLTACAATNKQPAQPTLIKASVKTVFESENADGCFILYNSNADQYQIYNLEHANQGLLPASTFKIYNSLIGLESGIITDQNYVIPWDGKPQFLKSWEQDHTLKSAIAKSCVPYYRELARRVGKDRMQQYIDSMGFGNQNISAGVDIFWLEGSMRITPLEQMELLQKLYSDQLPFSKRSHTIVKDILVLKDQTDYRLSGKTGTVMRPNDWYYSWFVGYVETNDNTFFFVTNLKKPSDAEKKFGEAKRATLTILNNMGITK
ncbi:class D beta-lactamase [Planctomycetota bacterium]|nr:class D beta-lactamase [Planctomycetota bacterium]